jgi:hypothetical protein
MKASGTIRMALGVSLWLGAGIAVGQSAYAHDWYPAECCSQHDCTVANAIDDDGRGGWTIVVGDVLINVPAGFAARVSPDNRVHLCFSSMGGDNDGKSYVTPICLFLPVGS